MLHQTIIFNFNIVLRKDMKYQDKEFLFNFALQVQLLIRENVKILNKDLIFQKFTKLQIQFHHFCYNTTTQIRCSLLLYIFSFSINYDIQSFLFFKEITIYNNMLKTSLALTFLVVLVSSQVNDYQQRCIYYSQADNACREIPDQVLDYINIIVNINDQSQLRRTIQGKTYCSALPLRYAEKLYPSTYMYMIQHGIDTEINFGQAPTRKYTFGLLSSLVQKVTVQNPAKIYGKDHTCTIMGDGTVQHFGSGNGRLPAEIYLRCVLNPPEEEKEETGSLTK